MFKKIWMFGLGLFFVFSGKLFAGDPIIGCPLGVEKGKVWLHSTTSYMSADKAYWNEDSTGIPKMTTMPTNWYAKILKSSYRTQLGITNRFSAGMLLTYWDKDISKETWKKKPNGEWFKKPVSYHSFGFGDIWFYGLYKIVKRLPRIEAISIGTGYKLDAADNSLVVHGIGSGARSFRFAFLTHINLIRRMSECSSIWYEYEGKVRHIEVKNDQGQLVEWEKSEWDLGDKYGYNLAIEYELSRHLKVVPKFMGWWKIEDKDKNGETVKNTKFYEHSLGISFQYFPIGTEYDHSKIIAGVKVPISSINSFSAPVVPMFMAMWTF